VVSLESVDTTALWRAVPALVLVWLAIFFGRTLRAGRTPLIERIARVSTPELTQDLRRYTRRLTAVWCAYFVVAASLSAITTLPAVWTGALVWMSTGLLFVGEHRVRGHLFPGHGFPGLKQQLRDTWRVWHPGS